MLKAGKRAKELITQILLFSRRSESARQRIQLQPIAEEALRLLRATLPASIRIEERIGGELPTVIADPTQINQVLLNLCVNAAQAMPEGGRLEVILETLDMKDKKVFLGDVISGRFVRLRVRDSGVGMDPETMRHIFEPFFTTKGVGEGTGLGLATVFGIVSQHEGCLDVSSAPGCGATFDIYLPVNAGAVAPGPEVRLDAEQGHESILYVDDEEVVSEVGKRLLERLGYQVTAMTDSLAALDAFRSNPRAFDMVITDQNMPGLTGRDLALRIHAVREDIPIVLCTGYSDQVTPETARECGIAEYVLKPVTSDELAGLVRRVLDGTPAQPQAG